MFLDQHQGNNSREGGICPCLQSPQHVGEGGPVGPTPTHSVLSSTPTCAWYHLIRLQRTGPFHATVPTGTEPKEMCRVLRQVISVSINVHV